MQPRHTLRYKHFLYACAKMAAAVEEGLHESKVRSIRDLARGDLAQPSSAGSVTGGRHGGS